MTFIISAANRRVAFQVADTRLTDAKTGKICDDLTVKTTVVDCADAQIAISYTGIASIDGVSTGEWIANRLTTFESWKRFFQDAMNYLRDELTDALKRNKHLEEYGLEVSVIGLGNSPTQIRQIAIAVIANCSEIQEGRNQFKEVSPKGRKFERYILDPSDVRFYIGCGGAMAPKLQINGMRRKLKKRLNRFTEDADPRPILDFLVTMLRLQRRDPRVSKWIGERCIGVAIGDDFNGFSVSYDPHSESALSPNRVKRP